MSNRLAKSLYIAGPMTGIPEYNYPAFFEAEDFWTECGYNVINPARNPYVQDPNNFDFKNAYGWDLISVVNCDAIYMLKGWQFSAGACGEHAVAVTMKKHNPEYEIIYGE